MVAVMECAVREAIQRTDAVAAAIYLLDEDRTHLQVAMIGGTPPSLYTAPGRMDLDAPYASAQALASGKVAALANPDSAGADQKHVLPYPYIALSAPVIHANHRFGAITVLRVETHGDYQAAACAGLQEIGDEFGITRERVRQIESRVKKKLADYMRQRIPDIKEIEFGA